MYEVILPELGEGIQKATLACWHCKLGDSICEGDEVAEVVTDKATFNVSAEKSGIVQKFLVDEGKEVQIGEALIVIE